MADKTINWLALHMLTGYYAADNPLIQARVLLVLLKSNFFKMLGAVLRPPRLGDYFELRSMPVCECVSKLKSYR